MITQTIVETTSNPQVSLPQDFANSRLIVQQLSDEEVRIRKVAPDTVITESDDCHFADEQPIVLSARDAEIFLEALANPPPPNEALRRLMAGSPEQDD